MLHVALFGAVLLVVGGLTSCSWSQIIFLDRNLERLSRLENTAQLPSYEFMVTSLLQSCSQPLDKQMLLLAVKLSAFILKFVQMPHGSGMVLLFCRPPKQGSGCRRHCEEEGSILYQPRGRFCSSPGLLAMAMILSCHEHNTFPLFVNSVVRRASQHTR